MKILNRKIAMYVADKGKVLEVFYNGETEPVYYDRICAFLIGKLDVVNEMIKIKNYGNKRNKLQKVHSV